LESLPSQLPNEVEQLAMVHNPSVHAAVALASAQTLPQAPQWLTLVLRSVSHWTAGLLSHSP
jgi:hypothetical protein